MGPVFRTLAVNHNWDANQVAGMTLAQIWMYLCPAAQAEHQSRETGSSRIDPNTGHTLVTVGSSEEAAALMEQARAKNAAK